MLFAAGFGTRMRPLTDDRPKPLIEVAGRPLIDHALALAEDFRSLRVVANLHYKAEMLETHLADRDVVTIREAPNILETGGGLKNALPILDANPVFTLNPDVVWAGPNPLSLLANAWEPARMDALLICVPIERTVGHEGSGDFTLLPDHQLQRGPGFVYGGAQIIRTDLLNDVSESAFSLNQVWDQMRDRQRLFGLCYSGHWGDVGNVGGIALAEKMLETQRV